MNVNIHTGAKTSKDWFDLAARLETTNPDAARDAYSKGLDADEAATELDRLLVQYPRWFPVRRKLGRFLTKQLAHIQADVQKMPWTASAKPKIFMYWNSGFSTAPPVVRVCHAQMLKLHKSDDVVLLDEQTWRYYADLPDFVVAKVPANTAYFSDILRASLLARHGGIWADATCFAGQDLLRFYPQAKASGFFAFRYHDARISSWFLMSGGDNYVAKMMFAAQSKFWEHHEKRVHQFMIHHIFETLYFIDNRFREEWDRTPTVSSREPHHLQQSMFKPYDAEHFNRMRRAAPVHKLTYKYKGRVPNPDMTISHLVRGDFDETRSMRDRLAGLFSR